MPDKDERQHTKNRVGWREFQNCEIKTYLEKICFLNLQYVSLVVDGKALILHCPPIKVRK